MRIPVLSLVLALSLTAVAQDSSVEIRQVLEAQTAAWNRGDLKSFMSGYWHSPEVTFFSGDTITKGWEQTLARYEKKYGSEGKDLGKLSFTDERIELLDPSSALVTARWHLAMSDGKKLEGLTTLLLKRLPEGWRIVHDHSS